MSSYPIITYNNPPAHKMSEVYEQIMDITDGLDDFITVNLVKQATSRNEFGYNTKHFERDGQDIHIKWERSNNNSGHMDRVTKMGAQLAKQMQVNVHIACNHNSNCEFDVNPVQADELLADESKRRTLYQSGKKKRKAGLVV